MPEPTFGQTLAMLRRRRGLSQRRLAELLCSVSGVPTISRNEVSRWERGARGPAGPWLGWLSQVLEAALPENQPSAREPAPPPSPAELHR
ncbi:MAG: helix-turn-helix domain-containing protein, partial [Dehalococcoidia bacterium]